MLLPILIESFYLQQLITDLITALEYEMQQNADRGQNAGNYPELWWRLFIRLISQKASKFGQR